MATLNKGSGADGDVIITINTNLNTDIRISGRSYPDMVAYSCSSISSNGVTLVNNPDGIVVGDEVLLINLLGISPFTNAGNYETFSVESINGTSVNFTSSKIKYYGDGVSDDTNIGVGLSNNRVILQRIPQYNNFTVNSGQTVTCNGFGSGPTGGVLFMRTKNTLLINGVIEAGIGGRGDSYYSTPGLGVGYNHAYGAAGSYATAGGHSSSGYIYGVPNLSTLNIGSGGSRQGSHTSSAGGHGAGIIGLFAAVVDIYGSLKVNGTNGGSAAGSSQWGCGGGSGGSLLIHAGTFSPRSSTINGIGGAGGSGWNNPNGGIGGDGRIAIYYNTLVGSINTTPTPYIDSDLQLPYKISGIISESAQVRVYDDSWNFIKSEDVSVGAYEISNLPNEGPFTLIADPTSDVINILGYKKVVSVQ